jgi:murein DD-endopeptidase / murein LD-carboxypeptidase
VDIALDCVGLVAHAAGFDGELPRYALKAENSAMIIATLTNCGFRRVRRGTYHVGDIVHVLCGPRQHHLLIRTKCGWVHAHAGLGRVVSLSGELPWPVLSVWRTKGI